MTELELKYGCNPNQKPARIFAADGELPVELAADQRQRVRRESEEGS